MKNFFQERPAEKLERFGAAGLSDAELISVVLGTGTKGKDVEELSCGLLTMNGGRLGNVSDMSFGELTGIPGIGRMKASALLAAFELGKRLMEEESGVDRHPIVNARMVYDLMIPRMKTLKHEECHALLLNSHNYLSGRMTVSSGNGNSTIIDSRRIIREALSEGASGIILVHNHPSECPTPSRADIEETEKLSSALRTMGISLLDHIIVCSDSFFSFSEDRMTVL